MGRELFETLLAGTGLPDQGLRKEMSALMNRHGKSVDALTLDDLREMLADYLQDVLVEAKANND